MIKVNKKYLGLAVILMIICIGIAAFFILKAGKEALEYKAGDDFYEELQDEATSDNSETDMTSKDTKTDEEGSGNSLGLDSSKEESVGSTYELDEIPRIDFKKLKKTCPDIVAWIYSPGTVINYPVVQGEDNSYYLTHLADGTENKNGCLFLEYENAPDFLDDNTVIYGHNMASGKMLAEILNYRSQEYFSEHPYMYLITEEATYRLEIFAGYTTDPGSNAYVVTIGNRDNYETWLQQVADKSDFKANMELKTTDRFVTLSTCSYAYKNARYVIHGRLVKEEEENANE